MPRPRHRTRSLRKIQKRTPGGRHIVHYEKRNKNWHKCAMCGKPLFGVPRDTRNIPKSSKRPGRPYGGYLCAECLKKELTLAIISRYAPNIKEEILGV